MARYRSKPAVLDAHVLAHDPHPANVPWETMPGFEGVKIRAGNDRFDFQLWVQASRAWCDIALGDAVAREPDGSGYYPIKAEVFHARWEPIPDDETSSEHPLGIG